MCTPQPIISIVLTHYPLMVCLYTTKLGSYAAKRLEVIKENFLCNSLHFITDDIDQNQGNQVPF